MGDVSGAYLHSLSVRTMRVASAEEHLAQRLISLDCGSNVPGMAMLRAQPGILEEFSLLSMNVQGREAERKIYKPRGSQPPSD